MELHKRVVLKIPLNELWTEHEILTAKRGKYLVSMQINELLQNAAVQFVIADVGSKLEWQKHDDSWKFYKEVIKANLIEDPQRIDLNLLKTGYGYVASFWEDPSGLPIILLEKYH